MTGDLRLRAVLGLCLAPVRIVLGLCGLCERSWQVRERVMRGIHPAWVVGLLLLGCSPAWGQPAATAYQPPADVAFRKATIVSEGSRLAAELFALKENEGK